MGTRKKKEEEEEGGEEEDMSGTSLGSTEWKSAQSQA